MLIHSTYPKLADIPPRVNGMDREVLLEEDKVVKERSLIITGGLIRIKKRKEIISLVDYLLLLAVLIKAKAICFPYHSKDGT